MVRYCLFLNGEFWGYYYLSEKYDEEYFSHYYSVDKDNVLYLKNGGIEEGEESDWALYEEFYDRVNNHDLAVEENFRKALEIIDFDSLVDYYAFMIYIQRYADWSPISSNYGFWRSKSIGDKMEDGKWRWVIFDVNSGTFNDSSEDSISRIATDDYIFKHFYANHTFVEALKGRLEFLRDEIFDLSAVNAFLDNFKATYKAQAVKEDIRFFGGSGDGVTFYNNKIESVRSFMNARPQYINDFLQSW